jgi:4-diphosphocytidyl-2-C-methyl-D-erythritol kinase
MTQVAGPQTVLRVRTHAKLNLFLRIAGRRPDGYHELESIFHGIELADDIEFIPTSTESLEVEMRLDESLQGELPVARENLVGKSVQALLDQGGRNPGIKIKILKRIPIAAGLGGGSGNAAGALVAVSEMWEMGLEKNALLKAAASVGSDVPYCISGGTVLAMQRGEQLTPLPAPDKLWFVIGISFRPLLTKEVYDQWDALETATGASSAPMTLALGGGDLAEIASYLHNDLEPAAFKLRPGLERQKERLLAAGALGASITGSGPTLFGLARDEEHARMVAAKVEDTFDEVLVTSSFPTCVERIP